MSMEISVLIRNEKQYLIAKKYPVTFFYSDNLELVKKYPEIYYQTSKSDIGLLSLKNKHLISDYSLNIANKESIQFLLNKGVEKVTLSVELNLEELSFFSNLDKLPVILIIYGRVINMILKKHPLFKENGYALKNKNNIYPIYVDKYNHVYIYSEPINLILDIKKYYQKGIKSFRIDLLDETEEEIKKIFNSIFDLL